MTGRATAYDVILAALAAPLPGPQDRPRTEDRARLVEAALIEHGHLPAPNRPTTEADVHEVARWLAEQSRHPRYVMVEDGWRRLLESEPDVHLATTGAVQAAANDADRESVLHARTMLLRWQREHPPKTPGDDPE